jgi:hypothetical protein
LALTEIIYQYRLKHVIDARQHKIEALTHIMDFLLERGIIDHANPRECLFIADVWDYFPRPSREFGWQLKLGAGFRYSYDNIQSTFTNDMEEWASYDHEVISYRMPYIAAIATYAQPFSLCWQVALYGDFTYVYDKEETDTRSHISYPGGELPLYHYGRGPFSYCTATLYSTLKYIYDSRTSGAMGPSFQIRDDGVTRATFYGFGTQVEYRISLPTTLGLKWTVGNSHYGTHRSGAQHSAWNHDITIDITHYLF